MASQNIIRFEVAIFCIAKIWLTVESSLSKITVKLVVKMKPVFTGKPSQQEVRSCTAQPAISEDNSKWWLSELSFPAQRQPINSQGTQFTSLTKVRAAPVTRLRQPWRHLVQPWEMTLWATATTIVTHTYKVLLALSEKCYNGSHFCLCPTPIHANTQAGLADTVPYNALL